MFPLNGKAVQAFPLADLSKIVHNLDFYTVAWILTKLDTNVELLCRNTMYMKEGLYAQ